MRIAIGEFAHETNTFCPGVTPLEQFQRRHWATGDEIFAQHRGVRDPLGGVVLRHRPRLQAGADLTLPLAGQHELSLRLRHLSRRFDSAIPTGDRWLSPSTTLDVALRRQWGPTTVLLALDDVTDARGEEVIGLDIPGRRLRLSLQWNLQ